MSYKEGRHSSSGRGRAGRSSSSRMGPDSRGTSRQRREPLQDHYYYEEPPQGAFQQFEDMSSYSSSRKKREDKKELERQKKKKGGKAKRAVIISLAVLLVLIGGALYYVFGYLLKDLTVDDQFTKDLQKLGIVTSAAEGEEPIVLDDTIKNIAMFGVDARGSSFEGLSDVVMILTVDNKHGKIKMTSILRDSCVVMEDGSYAKLTEIYGYGGPELAVKTLNQNFSIGNRPLNITEYVTVNFARMADIVDACGGVEIELTAQEVQQINVNLWSLLVDVDEQIDIDKANGTYTSRDDYAYITSTDMMPNIYGEKNVDSADYEYEDGKYLLNGNQAVAYGRIRYIDSDDMRATRQQNVLKALIERVRGKSKLEYPEMIRQIMPMCKTSLDFGDITGMLPIMFTDFTIETMNIPGEDEQARGGSLSGGKWVYVYDLEYAAKHISTFIYESDSQYFGQEFYPGEGNGIPNVPESSGGYSNETDFYAQNGSPSSSLSSDPESSEPVSSGWEEDPSSGDPGYEDPSSYPVESWPEEDPPNYSEDPGGDPSGDPSGEEADPGSYSGEGLGEVGDVPGTDEVTPY